MNFPTIVKVPKGCRWPHNPQDHSGSPSTLCLKHQAVHLGPRRQLSASPHMTAQGQQVPTAFTWAGSARGPPLGSRGL